MSDKIYLEFSDDERREEFTDFYNYGSKDNGRIETDIILGSGRKVAYIERDKVKNFTELGQDIRLFGGKVKE